MTYDFRLFLIVGILELLLSTFVIIKSRRFPMNVYVSFAGLSSGLWSLCWFLFLYQKNIIWLQLSYCLGFLPAINLAIALLFNEYNPSRVLKIFFLISIPQFLILVIPKYYIVPYIISYAPIIFPTNSLVSRSMRIYWFLILIFAVYNYLKILGKRKGIEKQRILWAILGFIIFTITTIVCTFIFPTFFNSSALVGVPPLVSIVWVAMLMFAILRHRLMDIEVVIKRSTYFLVLFGMIVFPTTYLVNFISERIELGSLKMLFVASVWSVMFLFVDQIKRFLERITDRLFFLADYNYDQVLADLTTKLQHVNDIQSLVLGFDSEFKQILKVENTGLYMLNHSRTRFYLWNVANMYTTTMATPDRKLIASLSPVRRSDFLLQLLKDKSSNCVLYSEIREEYDRTRDTRLASVLSLMESIGSRMIIGSVANDEVTGMITIGAKKSGADFKDKDINLLHNLVNQGALIVARIFEIEEKAKIHAEKELEEKHRRDVEAVNQQLQLTLTELKSTQERLLEEEQISAIGKIAGEVAHDMRNPLSSMNRFISSLYERGCTRNSKLVLAELYQQLDNVADIVDKVKLLDYIKFVLANIQETEDSLFEIQKINTSLRNIANEFLEYSRVSRDIPTDLVVMNEVIARQIAKGEPECIQHQINLVTDLRSDRKVCLFDHQIQKIFDNLFDNAQKAVLENQQEKPRCITVRLFDDVTEGRICLEVRDTGIGIPEDAISSIFKPFYTRRRNLQGTGLGLAIIKKIVDNHNGTLSVSSEVGTGTQFVIKFPYID